MSLTERDQRSRCDESYVTFDGYLSDEVTPPNQHEMSDPSIGRRYIDPAPQQTE